MTVPVRAVNQRTLFRYCGRAVKERTQNEDGHVRRMAQQMDHQQSTDRHPLPRQRSTGAPKVAL